MTPANSQWTPAERLAKRIVDRLKKKKLVGDKGSASLEVKLSRGQMTSAEWRIVFEKSVDELKKK